jgi:hypothetical protein
MSDGDRWRTFFNLVQRHPADARPFRLQAGPDVAAQARQPQVFPQHDKRLPALRKDYGFGFRHSHLRFFLRSIKIYINSVIDNFYLHYIEYWEVLQPAIEEKDSSRRDAEERLARV